MTTYDVVVLGDGHGETRRLARDIGLIGRCRLVDIGEEASEAAASSGLVVVSHASLAGPAEVTNLRRALGRHRRANAPFLCLTRNPTARERAQALAVGATQVLGADAERAEVLDRVRMMLFDVKRGEASAQDIARGYATKAALAFSEMMDAASNGATIPVHAISRSSDLVLQAVQKTDIRAWLDVVMGYDDVTYRHCLLVAGLAAAFAGKLNFGIADRRRLTQAALLHDLGKACIPLAILNKPGKLSPDEIDIMRSHVTIGYSVLTAQGGFEPEMLMVVRNHHEMLDGSGYPDGLKGDQIPDLVRLVTICDIYAALVERRSYKAALSLPETFRILDGMTGKIDPVMLEVFKSVVTETGN